MKNFLLLSGGGSQEQMLPLHQFFAHKVEGEILFIPHAMPPSRFQQSATWICNIFSNLAKDVVIANDLTCLTEKYLRSFGGIYIGGGNTYLLLDALRSAKVDTLLSSYYHSGGSVYGCSAGALIWGNTIKSAETFDENSAQLTNLTGLSHLQNLAIWPHYHEESDSKIIEFSSSNQIDVLAIPEDGAAIEIDGSLKDFGGKGKVYQFTHSSSEKIELLV